MVHTNYTEHMRYQFLLVGPVSIRSKKCTIKEWTKIKKQHKDLEVLEYEEPTKDQLLLELKEAFLELQAIEQGKLKSRPAKALLDEL